MRRSTRAKEHHEPTINITPLIDVVFVILIAFILIAPLVEIDRMELAKRASIDSPVVHLEQPSEIQIHVYGDNHIEVNQLAIVPGELASRLMQERKRYPEARAQLFCDKKASFGTYQEVKNALEQAGFAELDIVLLPS